MYVGLQSDYKEKRDMRNRPIRIQNTALGTIWVECYEADSLHLHPWWHESCRLEGQKLPFFGVTLRRVKSRWTIEKFDDGLHPWNTDAPKWPRGAREKVPGVVLENRFGLGRHERKPDTRKGNTGP
jgi:hypothetical protein